jgi:hypothetical protein
VSGQKSQSVSSDLGPGSLESGSFLRVNPAIDLAIPAIDHDLATPAMDLAMVNPGLTIHHLSSRHSVLVKNLAMYARCCWQLTGWLFTRGKSDP